jgi:hypothetical protein
MKSASYRPIGRAIPPERFVMVGVLKETQHAPTGSVRECFVSDKLTGVPS